MSFTNFNRHENMTPEVMEMVMDAIRQATDFSVSNMLYGLYDGFLYSKLEETHKELFDICAGYLTITEDEAHYRNMQ